MDKIIEVNAKTVKEARLKLWDKIVKGYYLISVEENDWEYNYQTYSGETVEEAITKSLKDRLQKKGEIVESGEKRERTLNCYESNTEEAASRRSICDSNFIQNLTLHPEYKIEEIKLIKKGKRVHFFSLKRELNTYELKITELPYVKVRYYKNATIKAKITNDIEASTIKFLEFAKYGNSTFAGYLLKCGIDTNVCNSDGENGLMLATGNNQIEMALFLIEKGIDIFRKDNFGRSVVGHIDYFEPSKQLLDILGEKGLSEAKNYTSEYLEKDGTYCNVCKENVETYESSYNYDDGWFTRECTKCSICGNILSTGNTIQN